MKTKLTLIAALVSTLVPAAAQAYIVNDTSTFDVAYGQTGNWTATETDATNTPTGVVNGTPFILGNFSILIFAQGGFYASQSVSIPTGTRTLQGDNGGSTSYNNLFTLVATYNGPAGPLGTTPGSEQVTFDIDSISIYGLWDTGTGTGTQMIWEETTSGHTGTGPSVTVINTGALTTPSNYTKIEWTTATDLSALGNTGTSITRIFQIPPGQSGVIGDQSYNPFDLFAVQGTATFSYDIPEPASLGLLALGAAAILGRRRR